MRKKRSFLFVVVFCILTSVSIGYAILSKNLNITGNSLVNKNEWNIYFDNIKLVQKSCVVIKEPTIDNSNFSIDFAFDLNLPGDRYEFTVDVVNDGSIDAVIESIVKTPELTEEQKKYIDYIIEYENGEQIVPNQLLESASLARLKIKVDYKRNVTEYDLPTNYETLNLGFSINYVQADDSNNAVKVRGYGIQDVIYNKGSFSSPGTIVTIGKEKFYTVGTDGEYVKLLSMYNLYVGGYYDYKLSKFISYGDEASGMQRKDMLGEADGINIYKGVTEFSNDEMHGINYSSYSGSIVEKYVNDYKNKLSEKYKINVPVARLITLEELTSSKLGCDGINRTCTNSKFDWLYSTSYWIGSPKNDISIQYVSSYGNFGSYYYDNNEDVGVRPLIYIHADNLD